NSLSDRNAKANITAVDGQAVLAKLASIPVAVWNYKTQDASIKHIGPMAQDFAAAFGVGEDNVSINTVDADGVSLAAIQGLYTAVQQKDARIAALESRLATVEPRLAALEHNSTSLTVPAGTAGQASRWTLQDLAHGGLDLLLVAA